MCHFIQAFTSSVTCQDAANAGISAEWQEEADEKLKLLDLDHTEKKPVKLPAARQQVSRRPQQISHLLIGKSGRRRPPADQVAAARPPADQAAVAPRKI
ncbi:hypothetical protein TRIUR3_05078 [Triticum urartu]|uniref:Uncharacterized protein n=1 Tax=Triticum urartu TaxID=4572 RepID=M7ZR12_TRIUA|nr:hypothetical protein TRIUR3_05078 [Triticum urartu]